MNLGCGSGVSSMSRATAPTRLAVGTEADVGAARVDDSQSVISRHACQF